ncbi:MAG TPA: dynamin family protein [Alphaproteobacteria bacterium]|nr:dynamin family protein [Alphaproteobacteria bacterium]
MGNGNTTIADISNALVEFYQGNEDLVYWGIIAACAIFLITLIWLLIRSASREIKRKAVNRKATKKRTKATITRPKPSTSFNIKPPPRVDAEKDPRGAFVSVLRYWVEVLGNFPDTDMIIKDINDLIINADSPLLIIVVGQFNTGKSTFINTILEKEVLSTDIIPETAAVTLLKYGTNEKAVVHHKNGKVSERSLHDIKNITSENSPEMKTLRDTIKYVEIHLNNSQLKKFSIVDTPGLNSTIALHSEVTKDFVSKGDLVLWLFSVAQPGSAAEIGFLRSMCDSQKPVGVLNQIDTFQKDEGDIRTQYEDIKRRLIKDVSGFHPVSSRMAFDAIRKKATNPDVASTGLKKSGWEAMWKQLENGVFKKRTDDKIVLMMNRLSGIMSAITEKFRSAKKELQSSHDSLNNFGSYKTQIKENISKLEKLQKEWERARNCKSTFDAILDMTRLPEMIVSSSNLNSKVESFRGIADRLIEQLNEINRKVEQCQKEIENHNRRRVNLDRRIKDYNENLGGIRSIWDDFKTGLGIDNLKVQLNAENDELISQAGILNARMKDYQNEGKNWESRRDRYEKECKDLCIEVKKSIDETINELGNKLKNQENERENLQKKISGLEWVNNMEKALDKNLACSMMPVISVISQKNLWIKSAADSVTWNELQNIVTRLSKN